MDEILARTTAVMLEPDRALADIPGWERAAIKPLAGGLMNRAFLVSGERGRAVLKVDDVPQDLPRNSRAEEAHVQNVACEAGLAGKVLYHDERCYLTEYIPGTPWTDADVLDASNLATLGRALRRLHRIPATGREFDALAAARVYAVCIEGQSEAVAANLESIAAVKASGASCFCHNDLVAENIVSTPDLRFIDWEYACTNDPLFDLATVIVHHELDDSHIEMLMSAYADGNWSHYRSRLEEQSRVYASLLWLWRAATRNS